MSEQKDQSQSSLSSKRGLNEPSGKVPSTITSCRAETTPGMTCLLPSMSFPSCIRSATECFPSRMNSCSCDAIRAVASVWLSLRPRASRFWAMQPTWRRGVEQGEERGRAREGEMKGDGALSERISRRTRPRDERRDGPGEGGSCRDLEAGASSLLNKLDGVGRGGVGSCWARVEEIVNRRRSCTLANRTVARSNAFSQNQVALSRARARLSSGMRLRKI